MSAEPNCCGRDDGEHSRGCPEADRPRCPVCKRTASPHAEGCPCGPGGTYAYVFLGDEKAYDAPLWAEVDAALAKLRKASEANGASSHVAELTLNALEPLVALVRRAEGRCRP